MSTCITIQQVFLNACGLMVTAYLHPTQKNRYLATFSGPEGRCDKCPRTRRSILQVGAGHSFCSDVQKQWAYEHEDPSKSEVASGLIINLH